MKKTAESVKIKWKKKIEQMVKLKRNQTSKELQKWKDKITDAKEKEFERKKENILKKSELYIKRKRLEYERKCKNEIRELEGKPKREYKHKVLTLTQKLKIVLLILQENSRLRDTDINGNGRCVSCNKRCSWEQLAGGHWFSRMFLSICIWKENINAQCHTCNWTTGPKGNIQEKEKVNAQYRENLVKKRGEDVVEEMEEKVKDEIKHPGKYKVIEGYLDELIVEIIQENKRLWGTKSKEFLFGHKPFKNWQRIYDKYWNV